MRQSKKPNIGLLPWMAIRRGTSPTQANKYRSYFGKARKSRNDDKSDEKIGRNMLKALDLNISITPSHRVLTKELGESSQSA